MSQPPPQSPWSTPPGEPPPGPSAPAFAVPAQPLQYVMPEYRGRPGLITAIGVISIVVASLSILFSLGTVMQAAAYYMISMVSSTAAAAQARATSAAAAPPVAVPGPVVAVAEVAPAGPAGMAAPERASAVAALNRLQPLAPSRKRHLEAILATAGKDMAVDRVTQSGAMPEMRSGETPPDYFVTSAGRLEVFNDRAVFYPLHGAPAIRASAPPPVAGVDAGGGPEAAGAEVEPNVEADSDTPNPSKSAAGPATAPVAATLAVALTPVEIQSIVQQAQSLSTNGLNPAQVTSLTGVLSAPGQQLVQPGAAAGAVGSAYAPAGGPAVVQFADGGSVTLGPQGNVTAMSSAVVVPTFNFKPVTLGLMVGSAVASLALAVYLLVCGILTLRQSPRGRRLHLIYALVKIPLAITAGLAAAWVARDMMAGIAGAGGGGGGFGYSLFSGLTPIVFGCAYPIALLIALNVKSVRDYYRDASDGMAGAPVGQ